MGIFVISEIGINHNGDIQLAKQMIQESKNCGADAVKFQKRDIDLVYDKKLLNEYRESPWGKTQRAQKQGLEFEEKDYVGLRAVASLTATIFGSTLVVNNAVNLAEYFNISSIIIGVTVVALGTSLPEVAGTIAAAKMKNPDIVFGNIFGSNLFNIALVGGVSVSIAPGVIETDVTAEMIIMLVASLIVILLSKSTVKKSYLIGLTALISYSVFIYTLF